MLLCLLLREEAQPDGFVLVVLLVVVAPLEVLLAVALQVLAEQLDLVVYSLQGLDQGNGRRLIPDQLSLRVDHLVVVDRLDLFNMVVSFVDHLLLGLL